MCVTGSGSIQGASAYELSFLGASPEAVPLASWPALDMGDHPLVLNERARAKVRDRLSAGRYLRLPDAVGQLTPAAPLAGERFLLRWRRQKTGHVGTSEGSWDTFRDTIELACRAAKPAFHPLVAGAIEGPSGSEADVFLLDGRYLLVSVSTTFGIEGDGGGSDRAVLADLREAGCVPPR